MDRNTPTHYKGLSGGPVSQRLSAAKTPKPTMLKGHGVARPAYPLPAQHAPGLHLQGLLRHRDTMEKADKTNHVRQLAAQFDAQASTEELDAVIAKLEKLHGAATVSPTTIPDESQGGL